MQLLTCVVIEMQKCNTICCVLSISKKKSYEEVYICFSSLARSEVPKLNMDAQF